MEKKQKRSKTPYIILAIVALVTLLLLLTIIYYSVLKPQQPQLSINDVILENLNPNSDNATLKQILQGLKLRMNMTLRNPNRGAFYYADLGVSMYYRGKELGFAMVPGGDVRAGGRVGFAVYVATMESAASFGLAMEMEGEEGKLEMVTVKTDVGVAGDVTVLGSFSHHTSISTTCFVSISTISLEVVTFDCGLHSFESRTG